MQQLLLHFYSDTKKMLSTVEIFTKPVFVYFRFSIGLKVKRAYQFSAVGNAIKNKLAWYFDPINRDFFEKVDFLDLVNWIKDTSNVSPTDLFSNVRGIESMQFRDIEVYYAQNLTQTQLANGLEVQVPVLSEDGYALQEVKNIIYEPDSSNYPRLASRKELNLVGAQSMIENKLNQIQLGPNQFPFVLTNCIQFLNEGA
jgi:hypothetical protein